MKKIFKIIGITLAVIVLLLIAVPFVFQSQIKGMVKNFINQNLNAQVEFSDVNLSLFRNFPNARVEVSDLVITNFEPFKDETLATAKDISFTMSIKELFKNADEDPIIVKTFMVDEALITIKTDAFGNTNYDIMKERVNPKDTASHGFTFDIKDYGIKNSAFTYIDAISKTKVYVTELNHTGKGTFSGELSELKTKSEANVSLSIDSTNYLNNNHVKLDALIDLDLNNSKYTFKENKAFLNQLPIEFDGFVQIKEDGQLVDISFKNTGSDFKDFLAVIPETYSKNLDNVETTGNFNVIGIIKGMITETTIPTLDISINSNNASFKYPDLPKRVENIIIDASIKNETGNSDDTYVSVNTLNFKIDNDVFKSSATIRNLTKNMLVNANVDGVLNLANLSRAYPLELENELSGILTAKINTSFDMEALEKNAYERIKASGVANLSNFTFTSDAMNNPLQISKAEMTFNPSTVTLNSFSAKTGKSDLVASGTIQNLIGFLLTKKAELKGNFNVISNTIDLGDFMSQETKNPSSTASSKTNTNSEGLRIPEFLDCTLTANVNSVIYDNLVLKDVKGTIVIKDQKANLNGLTSKLFDGNLGITGNVSTKTDTPTFNVNLDISSFDISKSFQGLELLQTLAPIAKVLQGKLNTTINLSGALDKELSPNLNTISGSAIAELLTTTINENQSELLGKLEGALSFIDFSKIDLKDLKTSLEFADGKVNIKPFKLAYKDIGILVGGSHSFDNVMSYNATFNVPAKYLGSDINRLIGKINDNEVNQLSIPVIANISGTFSNPKVTTDLTSGVSNLTKQLIEIEKQKLIGQGTDKIKDLLFGLNKEKDKANTVTTQTPSISSDSTRTIKTDTTTTILNPNKDKINQGVKDVLGGILGGKKKKKDTLN